MSFQERESLRYFAEELVGPKLQPGQERLVSLLDSDFERLQRVVIRKGRRSGMTTCAALVVAWAGTVLAPRFREHLLPREPRLRAPAADPQRFAVFALDGAVSRDSMALVGIDWDCNLIYARAWHPPKNGTIDHREVLAEMVALTGRFAVLVFAYDPNQIHGLVLDARNRGLSMEPVSQAGGRAGGTMARHTGALVEALHERRLRLFPSAELRQHVARSHFSARAGGDRLVKLRAGDKIDLAVALAMAVGMRHQLEQAELERRAREPEVEYVSAYEYLGFEPSRLNSYDDDDIVAYSPGPPSPWEGEGWVDPGEPW